eukprot:399117-Pleurochrysis_carterae.AAC.1
MASAPDTIRNWRGGRGNTGTKECCRQLISKFAACGACDCRAHAFNVCAYVLRDQVAQYCLFEMRVRHFLIPLPPLLSSWSLQV